MKITICGSMTFFKEIENLKHELEMLGFQVHTPSEEGTDIDYAQLSRSEQADLKQEFIDKHIERIQDAEAILIANYHKKGVLDYIGANTFLEMAFAYLLKKKIFILNALPDQANLVEMEGLKPIVLNGNISQLKTFFHENSK